MKKLAWGLAAVAVAVPLSLWARAAATRGQDSSLSVEVVRVTRRTLGSTVKATGVVKPRIGAEVKVGSRVSGVEARLYVRIGDTVRRGQLLAELETRELRARRDQAHAAHASAEATPRYGESDLTRKRSLAQAQLLPAADLDLAERARAVAAQQHDEAGA